MTTKALVIVFVVFGVVMLSAISYFAYDTYKIERRIDAMVKQHLEQKQR